MKYSPLHHGRRGGPPKRLRDAMPLFRVWPEGHEDEAVAIRSPFPETAVAEAQREHFGEGVVCRWEKV